MTLRIRGYVFLILTAVVLASIAFGSIINFTDPNQGRWYVFGGLYASVFVVVTGIVTLLGLLIRYRLIQDRFLPTLSVSLRQGILVGILFTSTLALQSKHLVLWWIELTILLFLVVVEALFTI